MLMKLLRENEYEDNPDYINFFLNAKSNYENNANTISQTRIEDSYSERDDISER